jgi:hypothetical protein
VPIRWAFNTTGLVQKIIELTETAMPLISNASQLTLVQVDMATSADVATDPDITHRSGVDISINCIGERELPVELRRAAGTASLISRIGPESERPVYVQASIQLVHERTTLGVVLHETMDALGLAHVGDRYQQMFRFDMRTNRLGKGDIAGIVALGRPLS